MRLTDMSNSAPGTAGTPGHTLSLRNVLHIVFRRKWLILFVFLACATVAVVAVTRLATAHYDAVAQLLVSSADVHLPGGDRAGPGPDERMARTVQLLTGRSMAEQVVEAVGPETLYPDLAERIANHDSARMAAVARLMKNLWVEAGARSSIISVGFRHEDPVMAAKIPNLLGELYIDRYLRVERNPRADAFFSEQLAALAEKLRQSQEALEAFRRRHAISASLEEERKRVSAEIGELEAAVAVARTRQAELERQLEGVRQQMALDESIPRSYYLLKERLATLETEASELARMVTPEHPKLRDLRQQIKGIRDTLAEGGHQSPYASAREQEDVRVNLQTELASARGELEAAQTRQTALAAQLEAARRRSDSLANLDSEANLLQAQLHANEEAHRLYLSKVQEMSIASMRDAERLIGVRVIEEARVPSAPAESRTRLKLLLGVLASAGAALGAAFLLQFAQGRLETAEDVERALGLPMLGSLPELRPRRR